MEVMTVIGVTIFLSLLAITYSRSTDTQIVLFRDQTTVVSVLNRAKSLTIEKFYEPGSITCAFGVHFDESSQDFILFQDLASNECDLQYNTDSGEDIETFSLDRRLSFALSADGATVPEVAILFTPPHLVTVSNKEFPITIGIQTTGGESSTISVSASGQITVTE